jgi:hypothetical protein
MHTDLKTNEPHRFRREKKQTNFFPQAMLHCTFRRQADLKYFICEDL